jgi:dihydrodipicolinate synthase/N-acetylneuraminate lyase
MAGFKGIIMPLPTPFMADGELDEALGCELADFEIGAGVNALFLLGSFGQGPVMREDQRKRYAETIIRHVRGRVPEMRRRRRGRSLLLQRPHRI